MSSRLRKLEEEIEKQERYSRRSNMLLYGMKEETGESFDRCATRVLQVLCRHFPQKTWKETDIERAHRLGPPSSSSDRPRPVIIKFQRWTDVMIVMRDREGKNFMRNNEGLRVGADLTKQQRDTLSQLRGQGKHAYYTKGKLIVQESRPYDHLYNISSIRGQPPIEHDLPRSHHVPQSHRSRRIASYAEAAAAVSPEIHDGASQPLNNWNDLMEDAALEEDPADDQPQEEECDVLTHQNTDSSMREKAELPASGSSTSPAGGPDHSPRPRGFGRGTPTCTTEQSTESRSGGSGGRGSGKSSSTQQSQANSRYQSQSSPMLTRNRSQSSASSSSRQGKLPSAWQQNSSGSAGTRAFSRVRESFRNDDSNTHGI